MRIGCSRKMTITADLIDYSMRFLELSRSAYTYKHSMLSDDDERTKIDFPFKP